MAQQVNVKFVDDLDGSDAAGTVSFAIDGRAYEIDLSEDNAARLRDSLASFVGAGRKSGGTGAAAPTARPRHEAMRGGDAGRSRCAAWARSRTAGSCRRCRRRSV